MRQKIHTKTALKLLPALLILLILSFGNCVYKHFFVTEGLLSSTTVENAIATDQITIVINRMSNIFDETYCMKMDGWAFIGGDQDQALFDKQMILRNDQQVFSLETKKIELTKAPAGMENVINWEASGFSSCLSKYALDVGKSYVLGMKFRNIQTNEEFIGYTTYDLVRTPNKILIGRVTKK